MSDYEEKALAVFKYLEGLGPVAPEDANMIALAQVYATLYLGEQQHIQNLLTLASTEFGMRNLLVEQAADLLGYS
jgi:hypothetical protein